MPNSYALSSRTMTTQNMRFTYTSKYRVTGLTASDGPVEALAAGRAASPNAVPAYYAVYPSDGAAYAQDFNAELEKEDSDFCTWIVSVTWRPLDQGVSQPTDPTTSPENRAVLYWLEFWEERTVVAQAWNVAAIGTWRTANTLGPIQNAAADEYDQPLEEEDKLVVLCAKKNFLTLASALTFHRDYNRTVNSDSFKGYAAHCAKFVTLELGQAITETVFLPAATQVTYYPGVVKIALRDTPWYVDVVNKGMRYRTATGERELCVDKNGQPVSAPVNLAANGTQLGDDLVGNVIQYRTRRAVAYSGMGLT